MLWLPIAISCYALFAVVFLVDKYLLAGPIANPRVLAFYVGMLGIAGVLAIPFGLVAAAGPWVAAIALATGAIRIWATYFYFRALQMHEVSRITTAINAFQPVISFWLAWMVSGGAATLDAGELASFALILVGSVVIIAERRTFTFKTLRLSLVSAFLFSLSFIGAKQVYDGFAAMHLGPAAFNLDKAFVSGFVWMGFGSLMAALFFLFSRPVRDALQAQKSGSGQRKAAGLFLANQTVGAAAFILQNYAVNLAPLAFVAIINALAGVQYVFLFIFTVLLSLYFPKILKERITPAAIFQKIIAIALIIAGLAIFALK